MYSVIIPTHNREEILKEVLTSFKKMEGLLEIDFELIIIANACIDETVSTALDLLANVTFKHKVIVEETAGLSVARNRGITESEGDVIVFLDDDVKMNKLWLVGLDKSFKNSDFDIIGGKISLWWKDCFEPSWFTTYERRLLGFNDHGDQLCRATPSMVFGGNFAFKKEVLDSVGGFDTKFGRVAGSKGAGEESDFVTRATKQAFSVGYSPWFEINHLVTSDKIKYDSIKELAIGAGKARNIIKKRTFFKKLLFIVKLPVRIFRVHKKNNKTHAKVIFWDRMAESGILQ